jgi:hypothetical protein
VKYILEDEALHKDETGRNMYSALESIIRDVVDREKDLYYRLSKINDFYPYSLVKKKVDEAYENSSTGTKYYIVIDSKDSVKYAKIVKDCLKNEKFITPAKNEDAENIPCYYLPNISQRPKTYDVMRGIVDNIDIIPTDSKKSKGTSLTNGNFHY